MRNIHIVTGFGASYLPHAVACLKSLQLRAEDPVHVFTVGFRIDPVLVRQLNRLHFVEFDPNLDEAANAVSCIQHGAFVQLLTHVPADDVVIWMDADIYCQRWLSESEKCLLRSLQPSQVMLGLDSTNDRKLIEDIQGHRRWGSQADLAHAFHGADSMHALNCGVIAARKDTFASLYREYCRFWPTTHRFSDSFMMVQYSLAYLVQRDFQLVPMPPAMHTHGHHPIDLRIATSFAHGVYVDDTPVVWAHVPVKHLEVSLQRAKARIVRYKRRIRWLAVAIVLLTLLCLILLLRGA